MTTHFLGAHVSTEGGVFNAPLRAKQLGANAFACFVKNQLRWFDSAYTVPIIERFKANLAITQIDITKILAHAGFLINLGNATASKRELSLKSLLHEMTKCEQLGITKIVLHPGSHLGEITVAECLELIADGLNAALAATKQVTILLENTAGQGSNLGYTFEQLAWLINAVKDQQRIGICLDTCHLMAAGYSLANDTAYQETFQQFDDIIGLRYLQAMHLNDCRCDCGAKLDRHMPLGEGTLGWGTFRRLMLDTRFRKIPMILETPESTRWKNELLTLRHLEIE